ncbi:GntR family transcriptional regulator [Mycolicibacterium smegmatis]|uniref:GntR-family protein transcriptional regulator n=3 Tax=Mycolicibacterium smegmatis TaxID=1772 RepID=A0R380_MYCS2|nr:GntR-family protein transcriptional regulator [Mycolicibacterium smegmatis MC2 155]AIU17024.1 GntR family transcriptional regulator [Mycolicibacterium smegmatis]AIU10399.1 GntR family transcriptional regulator [Mycolicibacterium smegmatis MC2 155]AIU23647.1 GntR family transcriptional regulator [Mycolicibacterium smegmatis]MBE9618827.1 FadR family transcriptional regulator [Mycolicibacterium smegmatis]
MPMTGQFGRVDRRPLYEQVADRLREFIDTSGMQPGDKLANVRDLAAELQVGRSSIREAVNALRAQRIVEVRHGDGIYLLQRPEDVIESLATELVETHVDHPYIWETRQALETQCARLAAVHATDDDLRELDASLDQMRAEVEKGLPGLEGDRRFHLGVAVAAHNPLLLRLLKGLRVALDRTSETSLTRPGQPARSLEEHRGVVEAIRAGDAADAANKMLAHLVGTTDELVRR